MSLKVYPSKRFYKAAAALGSVWGTAVAVAAGDELILTSDGNPVTKQSYAQSDRLNQVMPTGGNLGAEDAVEFSPEFGGNEGLPYQPGRLGSLIAALFGTEAAPAIQGTSAAYKHVFGWADYADYMFTFITSRPNGIIEIPSLVPTKLSLKIGNGKLQGTITLKGNQLKVDSTTNTETQLNLADLETSPYDIAIFQDLVMRINSQSGSALASGDSLQISDMSLEFERVKDAKMVAGGAYIALPREQSVKISGKFSLPHDEGQAMTWLEIFKAKTAQKADFTFTGPVAASTYHYSWKFGFPRIVISNPPDSKLADIIETGLEFVAEEASAAPSGMTGYTRPYAELVDLRTTAYLT